MESVSVTAEFYISDIIKHIPRHHVSSVTVKHNNHAHKSLSNEMQLLRMIAELEIVLVCVFEESL